MYVSQFPALKFSLRNSCGRWKALVITFTVTTLLLQDFVGGEKAGPRRATRASEGGGADPNVALEGQCIVVCDADAVATKPQIRSPAPEDSGMRPGLGMWDKMKESACGGLVSVGRRARKVAFSVRRSTELASATSDNDADTTTVIFDYVMVNVGNAFNTETSEFVAPVSGVYSLSFQVYRIFNKSSLKIDLYVNGIPVLRGFADGEDADHNSAHSSGLIHLTARDVVSVRLASGSLESGWKYSTFSGYLVFEDDNI